MNSIIVNENTLALAKKQMRLAYRRCYLSLQHYLLNSLKWADEEQKKEIKKGIFKAGEIYKKSLKMGKNQEFSKKQCVRFPSVAWKGEELIATTFQD